VSAVRALEPPRAPLASPTPREEQIEADRGEGGSPGCIVCPMAHGSTAATAGIGFGTALAITISWSVNKSILWAIIHGIFSWFYVIYFALFK
jgi:hypothetical protein